MNGYLALFDLDETIINCKSLIEVYKAYCLSETSIEHFNMAMQNFKSQRSHDISRSELNRIFYSNFSGISRSKMLSVIRAWFLEHAVKKDFFKRNVVNELREHQANGATVIIVSGSFYDCVSPIAEYLDVQHFLSIDLEHVNNTYTGKIRGIQTIAEGKLMALTAYIEKLNLNTQGSYGYGDHISDLPFLNFVEHPVILEGDRALMSIAHSKNWRVISV